MKDESTQAMTHLIPQRILPLTADAISQIHSSKHITSLQGVVLSLVENSLDAGATKINISVDWRRGGCVVDDDGEGIPASDFGENGGLARMYCTSKRAPVGSAPSNMPEVHSSTGTFLAELAAMSLLSITSTRAPGRRSANLTLHQNKVISRRVEDIQPDGIAAFAQQVGSSITVRDLFGNMPVRVKHRALASESGNEEDRFWHELKQGIVGLLVAWPKPGAVRLRDSNTDARALTLSGQHPNTSASLTSKSLRQLTDKAVKYDLRDVLPILFQSGFASADSRPRWVPLSVTTSTVSLKALICLDPAPSRHCQFIAIGIHPCCLAEGRSEIYDSVNKIFASSSFGSIENDINANGENSPRDRTSKSFTRRGIDRFPMYIIQLRLRGGPQSDAGFENMSETSLQVLNDVLGAAITAWLDRHHFRPKKRRRRKNEKPESMPLSNTALLRPSSAASGPDLLPKVAASCSNSTDQGSHPMPNIDLPKRTKGADLARGAIPQHNGSHIEADVSTLSRIRSGQATRPAKQDRAAEHSHERAAGLCSPSLDLAIASPSQPAGPARVTSSPPSKSGTVHQESNDPMIASEDFGSIDDEEMILTAERLDAHTSRRDVLCEDGIVRWTDPNTKQVYQVNSRTGIVLPLASASTTKQAVYTGRMPQRLRAGIDTNLSSAGNPISLARRKALMAHDSVQRHASNSSKLPDILDGWTNPVFARQTEEPIPVASVEGPGLVEMPERRQSHEAGTRSHNGTSDAGVKLSRSALREARVIGQVDNKFILCNLPADRSEKNRLTSGEDPSQTLVLIDQHAASERAILEGLLDALCVRSEDLEQITIRTASLLTQTARAKSIVFEISDREQDLFLRYRNYFAIWGILYDLVSKTAPSSTVVDSMKSEHRLVVKHLPAVVAERCANFPALCIEMLRTELWQLADGGKRPLTMLHLTKSGEGENNPNPWVSILPLLPDGLRDMLHSRSCRSAIMFNDALTQEECEKLVTDLSHCVFPFICAHGRTSMVPLAQFDADSSTGAGFQRLGNEAKSARRHSTTRPIFGSREETCDVQALARWMVNK